MKKYLFLFAVLLAVFPLMAQLPYNSAIPNGYTKKAMVSEQVGLTTVSITYHRPAVNGREGKIWGGVVHKGFIDQGFGNRQPAPWRAGANENTAIEFDQEVKVEGKLLPKGKYGLFIAYDPAECIVIFSKRSDAWGSFFYNEKEDALRVRVQSRKLNQSVELLKYEFSNESPGAAVISLLWEKLAIPFAIEVDYLKQQFDALVAESQNPKGFTSQGLNMAANWCLQNNYQLEKALDWSILASGQEFPGDPSYFPAWSTRVMILNKLEKPAEALAAIEAAMALGSVQQLQQFGKQLLSAKNPTMALKVFRYNYDKHPALFITLTGMVRGLSANGEYEKALEFARQALPLARTDENTKVVENMIEKLKEGKDVN